MSCSCCRVGSGSSGGTNVPILVLISKPRIKVRWTGHLSAMESNFASISPSSGPSKAMLRVKRSRGGVPSAPAGTIWWAAATE